jgi:hypothetical protein
MIKITTQQECHNRLIIQRITLQVTGKASVRSHDKQFQQLRPKKERQKLQQISQVTRRVS